MRYILTSVLFVGLFGAALYMRGAETPEAADADAIVLERSPTVRATKVEGGTDVQVSYRFTGACSRATVVYRLAGEDKVLASTTNCRRQLQDTGRIDGDGYVNEVELAGVLPEGASDVRLVLESETGKRVAHVKL